MVAGRTGRSGNPVPAAMILAVARTVTGQTVVATAVPQVQEEPGPAGSGLPWAVNACLPAPAAS